MPGDGSRDARSRTLGNAMTLAIHIVRYPLEDANRALDDLRAGRVDGTAVLAMRS